MLEQIDNSITWLENKKGHLEAFLAQRHDAQQRLDENQGRAAAATEALEFVSEVGAQSQELLQGYIEETVALALQAVFERDYGFVLDFQVKYRQPRAEFFVERPDGVLVKPKDEECGGGVSDIVALALRFICFSLEDPAPRPFMVLDEPIKWVDPRHRPQAVEFLIEFVERFVIQLLLITHDKELLEAAERIYWFDLDDEIRTLVEQLK